jgi:glycosyltransferase involved in cell wall biosynthesis
MKILFLTRKLLRGGAERQMVELAKGLKARGFEVGVVVFYLGGALDEELRVAGVPLHGLAKGGRWDVVGFFVRLVRLLRREAPSIFYGYLPMANILTALSKPFLPATCIVWGVRASNMIPSFYDGLSRIIYRIEIWLSRIPDLIIANSVAGAGHAREKGFPADRTVVIPNGINTDRFRPLKEAGQSLRAEWGLDENVKVVGLVGRLDPMKGHSTFLRAAALMAKRQDDLRFVCVGDGPNAYRLSFAALGRELGLDGRLMWVGGYDDMYSMFNAFDILCLSSGFGEGFPNVVGEAMACGVPCVVTDVGDSAVLVGDSGVVVPPDDPEALASGCERMLCRLQDQGGRLGSLVRERIEKNFNCDLMVENTYRSLFTLVEK